MDTNGAHSQKADETYSGEAFRPGEKAVRPVPHVEAGGATGEAGWTRSALLQCRRGLHTTGQLLWAVLRRINQWSKDHRGPYWHTIYHQEEADTSPYMTRFVCGRLRVHVFYRGDTDPDPHDHPWGFWTFPLVSYVEEVTEHESKVYPLEGALVRDTRYRKYQRIVNRFRWHRREAVYTHRVIGPYEDTEVLFDHPHLKIGKGKIITIVWRDAGEERSWGFLKNRDGKFCWLPWKEYVQRGGKHAPCE